MEDAIDSPECSSPERDPRVWAHAVQRAREEWRALGRELPELEPDPGSPFSVDDAFRAEVERHYEGFSGFLERMSGGGHIVPSDAEGLLRYWEDNSGGRFGMDRADFVAICRTYIENGSMSIDDRLRLVDAGWHEMGD